jgi:putative ABC transport system substrate-binding protein
MQRRSFITLLGGAAAARPLAARAQQAPMPVVGYLSAGSPEESAPLVAAFRKGLSESGYTEGRNVAIEYRWAQTDLTRLPDLVADLIRRRVSVLTTPGSTAAALAAKSATATIPIVYSGGADPVRTGLVASLNRPGGNITGINTLAGDLGAKRLGLLHELLPRATRFALLARPDDTYFEVNVADAQAAASAIGGEIEVLGASTNREIDAAFATLVQRRVDGLVVGPGALFANRRVQLATLAARHAVPAIYAGRSNTAAGGLMSYGPNQDDQHRQVGLYVGRILKGEKPADLPVMRPTKFEFVINLQTARLLGIDIPATVLAIADEVIE